MFARAHPKEHLMSKPRRTPLRRRPPLSVEWLESREAPTNLSGLADATLGAVALAPTQPAVSAGGGEGIVQRSA